MSEKKIYLTSGEIASLWTGYMNDSMSKCFRLYAEAYWKIQI